MGKRIAVNRMRSELALSNIRYRRRWWLGGLFLLCILWVHIAPGQRAAGLIARGDVRFIQRRYNEALDYYRQAIVLNPSDFRGYQRAARASDTLGNLPAALRLYQRALTLRPGHEPTSLLYAQCLLRAREFEAGREVLKNVLAQDPGSMEARYIVGGTWETQGDFERAKKWYGTILEIHPHLCHVEFSLGSIALKEKRYEDAVSHFRYVFGQAQHWDFLALEGSVIALLQLDKPEEAESRLLRIVSKGGRDHVPSRMLLIEYYLRHKNTELARRHLEIILNRGVDDKWTRQARQIQQIL